MSRCYVQTSPLSLTPGNTKRAQLDRASPKVIGALMFQPILHSSFIDFTHEVMERTLGECIYFTVVWCSWKLVSS